MSKGQLRVESFMVHIYFQILGYFVINDVPYHLERIFKSSVLYLLNLLVFIVTITLYDDAACFLLLGALISVYNVPYFLFRAQMLLYYLYYKYIHHNLYILYKVITLYVKILTSSSL